MDGRGIAAGALADAGLRRLTSEADGPRPDGVEQTSVERAIGVQRMSAVDGERELRPRRD